MYFTNPEKNLKLTDTFADGEPATFLERTAAAYQAGLARDRLNSAEFNLSDTIAQRNKAIKDATGVELFNPMNMGGSTGAETGAVDTRDWFADYEAERKKIAEKHPDKAHIIQADKPIRIEDRDRYTATVKKEEDAQSNYGGPTGTGAIADFAGGMGAVIRDPAQLPAFAIGPNGPVRQTIRSILTMGVKQAAANAATQAAVEPIVQNFRKRMGDTYGIAESASNVAMAAAFGFGADVIGRSVYRSVQGSLGRKAILDADGAVKGYESAEASIARATRQADSQARAEQLKALQDDGTVQRAIDGDPDAIAKVDPILGLSEDPAFRGARQAQEFVELEPGDFDDIAKSRTFNQALRAAIDADEPPPVIKMERASNRPSLSDDMEIPKGTEGNQHFRTIDIEGKPVHFQNLDSKKITTDADAMQFKSGGNQFGVTGALGINTTFDPAAAGKVIVFERADGMTIIVDGHQRLSIAKDGDQFQGFVFREKDGWSAAEVRAEAALKNIQEGRANLLDTVSAMREHGPQMEGRIAVDTDFMRQAVGMSRLSDAAFVRLEAGTIEPHMAALVGELVPDATKHDGVMQALLRANPPDEASARKVIGREIREPVTVEDQTALLGAQDVPDDLIAPRSEVLGDVVSVMRQGTPEQMAASVIIERLSDRPGYVSNLLTDAARAIHTGQPKTRVVDAFMRQIEVTAKDGGVEARIAELPRVDPLMLPKGNESVTAKLGDTVMTYSRVVGQDKALYIEEVATKGEGSGKGNARALLQGLAEQADVHGMTIDLLAQPGTRTTDLRRLVRLYESIGFVATSQTGHGVEMIRLPLSNAINQAIRDGSEEPARLFALSDISTGRSMRADLDALGYYSKALEAAKAIPQAKGTPEQMLAALKKAGVKDAEIEATGLRQWLAEKSAAPEIRTAYKVNGTVYDLPGLATHTDVMGSAIDKMGFKTAAESNKWIGTAETQSGFTVGGKFIGKAEAAEKLGMAPYELDSQSQNVSRLLELFPKANSITRDDLVKHLTENRVGLREVVNQSQESEYAQMRRELTSERQRPRNEQNPQRIAELESRIDDMVNDTGRPGAAKFSAYSLDPSNPSYRETVLHLPLDRRMSFDEFLAAYRNRFPNATDVPDAQVRGMYDKGIEIPGVGQTITQKPDVAFQSGHFDEPNIIGHMMTSLNKHEGKPVYTLDQIQSDWGQKIRDGGVLDTDKVQALKTAYEAADQRYKEAYKKASDALVKSSDGGFFTRKPSTSEVLSLQEAADAAQAEARRRQAEYMQAGRGAPGHPLVNTTDQWTTTTLRRALRQAAEADAEFIAIPHGDTVLSYNPGDEAGMRGFYGSRTNEGIVPKNLRKLLEKLDKDAKPTKVETLEAPSGERGYKVGGESAFDKSQTGFTLFPLTDKVKRSVLEEGQPLFSRPTDTPAPSPLTIKAFTDNLEAVLKEAQQPSPPRLVDDVTGKDGKAHLEDLRETMAQEIKEVVDPATAQAKMLSSVPGIDPSKPLLYTAKANELQAEIRKEIDRTLQMLPPDVRIRAEDELVFNLNGGSDARIAGLWDGYDRLVYVALSGNDPVRAVRHEVIHALKQSGLLTADEFKQLYAFSETLKLRGAYKIDERYRDLYTKAYGERGGDYVENLLREETIAEMFADYSLNGRRFGDVAGGGLVDRLIDRIVSFMKLLRDNLGFLGFRNINDIFQAIESGEVASRPSSRNPTGGRNPDVIARQIGEAVDGDRLASFAGERAATADLTALSTAKQMEVEGKPREDIWSETGWFKGVDGKWRFEISDDKAYFDENAAKDLKDFAADDGKAFDYMKDTLPFGGVVGHGGLYGAYPALSDLKTHFIPNSKFGSIKASFSDKDGGRIAFNDALDAGDGRSYGIHEAQHALQSIEGFARGGRHDKWPKELLEAERSRIAAEQSARPKRDDWTVDSSIAPADMTDVDLGRSLYRRLAGEAEARLVQKRMNMTPEERRARPPWLDFDVPESDQIVRMTVDGQQMSMARPSDMINAALEALPDETATAIRNVLKQANIDEAQIGSMVDSLMPMIRSGDQAAVAERVQAMAKEADPVMMPPRTEFGRALADVQADKEMLDVIGACRA